MDVNMHGKQPLKKALKILMMNDSSLSNLLKSYKQFKNILFDIKMNIKDRFPNNVQYTIAICVELYSHDMLDE